MDRLFHRSPRILSHLVTSTCLPIPRQLSRSSRFSRRARTFSLSFVAIPPLFLSLTILAPAICLVSSFSFSPPFRCRIALLSEQRSTRRSEHFSLSSRSHPFYRAFSCSFSRPVLRGSLCRTMHRWTDCGQAYWRKEIFRTFSSANDCGNNQLRRMIDHGQIRSRPRYRVISDIFRGDAVIRRRRGCVTRARFTGFALQRRIAKYRWNFLVIAAICISRREKIDTFFISLDSLTHWKLSSIVIVDGFTLPMYRAKSAKWEITLGNISIHWKWYRDKDAAKKIHLKIVSWHVKKCILKILFRDLKR